MKNSSKTFLQIVDNIVSILRQMMVSRETSVERVRGDARFLDGEYFAISRAGNEGSRYSTRNDETKVVNYDVECKRDPEGERAWWKGREIEGWRTMKGKLGPLLRNSNRVVRTTPVNGPGTRRGKYYTLKT